MRGWVRRLAVSLCVVAIALSVQPRSLAQTASRERTTDADHRMSGMGRLAHLGRSGRLAELIARARAARIGSQPDDDDGAGPAGGQGETSIAVDASGQHIVIGINDTRGFTSNPLSVSGFMYSDDGGTTFHDGGQLPVTIGPVSVNGTIYPQVFGDPDVKYLGGSTFVYFSIMVKSTGAQTMGVHRSTDFGQTWQGPFEIVSATVTGGTADKEFADVDPDTGRVMMTWSNFTATGGVEISATYSDDVASGSPPTWSARSIIANGSSDGQASIPRFAAHGSNNVYVAWRRFVPNSANQNVGFARSTDNGVTFSAPINIAADFFTMDQVLGNDRNNTSPSLAVDTSLGPFRDRIYVVYSNNDSHDGADVVFQRSSDLGLTFSAPVKINSRPGSDRAQWFPWITVDPSSGRVYVFYYDQGIATDGDLTETMYQFSDDGGATWSRPVPLSDRPFHAAYGNDTGEPNLGDYNEAVAQNGELFAVWAGNPPLVGFADGEPASTTMTVPDAVFKRLPAASTRVALHLGAIAMTDAGPAPLGGNGFIDPGEQVSLTVPLVNYVTSGGVGTIAGVSATLSTATPGVTVVQNSSTYPDIAAGAAASNATAFVIATGPTFVPGAQVDLTLTVSSAQGSTTLPFTQASGTPVSTILLSETFDGVSSGRLTSTWQSVHGGGTLTVPWTTRNLSLGLTPTSISNAAYHANDGNATGDRTRWERLFSPTFSVPSSADWVTVDFDIAYDTEDEPALNVQAYDGVLLRIFDQTAGRASRSVAVEAFAEDFTTGGSNFYPKHLVRSSNPAYFPDLSAWAGDSSGYRHVHLKLPGMGGSTAQLRFEFTQDSVFSCASIRPGHTCGVLIDNVFVRSVRAVSPTGVAVTGTPDPAQPGEPVTFTATVTTLAGAFPTDGSVTFREGAVVLAGPTPLSSGQASFSTSTLAAGAHTISADYTGTSGIFANATGSAVEIVGAPTTASWSTTSLTFTKQRVGTASAAQIVHVRNTGGAALMFASFDDSAPSATFAAGPDFTGETTCPLTAPGLAAGGSCDFAFVLAPSTSGPLGHTFSIVDTAVPGVQTITLTGVGFVVDEPTVLQTLVAAGARLRSLQNADGGWFFGANWTDCFAGTGVSCPNTLGVTGLALPFAYSRTSDPALLAVMTKAGDALVARYSAAVLQTPPPLPYSQDVEFLVALGSITGNATYSTTAQTWFQLVIDRYPSAADRIDAAITARNAQGMRSLAAWDAASLIRAAVAVGQASYALSAANRIVAREPDWRDESPGAPAPGNPSSYDETLLGEGSLLWAFHDLPGFDAQIAAYRSFLVSVQDPAGSWDGGETQITAYVLTGLAAVGGADAALTSAAAFLIANQLPQGGWPDPVAAVNGDEYVEVDAEITRAMSTLFNTPGGASVQVSPAQLATVTFSRVGSPGRTTVVATQLPGGPTPPSGYTILAGLTYQVTTTAEASGNTQVCFAVPWISDAAEFSRVRVLHAEESTLVDRTIASGASAPDFASRRVCALVAAGATDGFAIALQGPDVAPPTLSVTLTPSEIWPPTDRLVSIAATIVVHDDSDPAPTVTLLSIVSSEHERKHGHDHEADIVDAVVGTDDRAFRLRAEPGVVYTIVYRAADHAGHVTDVTSRVRVARR